MIHFPPLAAFLNRRWASAGLFHFIRETLHLSYSPVSSRWTFQKTCRSLLSLLQRYAPQSIHALTPSHLLYRRVAVDADYFIARFAHVASPDLLPPSVLSSSSDAGRVMRRIRPSLLRLCRWLQRQSLRSPIFVFDGVRVQAKNGEATRRLRLREEALEKHRELWESLSSQGGVPTTPSLSTLSTPAEQRRIVKQLLSYQQRIHHPTAEMKQECMRLLRQHSAAVVRAPNEAEAMCAHLAEEGHVEYAITEDSDCLIFGEGKMLKHILSPESMHVIDATKVRHQLNLSRLQLIDLAILCGSDFSGRLSQIGPQRAYDLLQTYSDIPSILTAIRMQRLLLNGRPFTRARVGSDFDYEAARAVYLDKCRSLGHVAVSLDLPTQWRYLDFKPDVLDEELVVEEQELQRLWAA